jgi:hypothetical protein
MNPPALLKLFGYFRRQAAENLFYTIYIKVVQKNDRYNFNFILYSVFI